MDIIKPKEFPQNYPEDAVAILRAMSFTDGRDLKVLGSMGLRSQQYAGDYDGYEIVRLSESSAEAAADKLVKRFQQMLRHLRTLSGVYIGDCKAGAVAEWRIVLPSHSVAESRERLDLLRTTEIISETEFKDARRYLKAKMKPVDWTRAEQNIKFHIVRWTPDEILAGKKALRDGRTLTLSDAFQCPSIVKLDAIGFVQNNKFTDFSVIYELWNRKTPLNPEPIDIEKSLMDNIKSYAYEGDYFKVLKRRFAMAKYKNDMPLLRALQPILNSDLGRLYSIVSDIGTLIDLLEAYPRQTPYEKIGIELEQFIARLANIYTLSDVIAAEAAILRDLKAIRRLRDPSTILRRLHRLYDRLSKMLNANTWKIARKYL